MPTYLHTSESPIHCQFFNSSYYEPFPGHTLGVELSQEEVTECPEGWMLSVVKAEGEFRKILAKDGTGFDIGIEQYKST